MTARPIRYQRQVSDRKGKIFYTSIASLSHISKNGRFTASCIIYLKMLKQCVVKRIEPAWQDFGIYINTA